MEPRGIEPLAGPAQPAGQQGVTDTPPETLRYSLRCDSQINPTLARIIDVWPALPEAIRRAMLALAESGQ
jgi:hypothetical protein